MNSFFSITTFSMYINNCFIHNSYPPQIPILRAPVGAASRSLYPRRDRTGHAGGGFAVRKTGSYRFLFHANIHWAYYKISSAGYRVPFAFFQFDFF